MQQSEKIAEGLDNQSLSLDFLLCLIFLMKLLISTTPQKDALRSSKLSDRWCTTKEEFSFLLSKVFRLVYNYGQVYQVFYAKKLTNLFSMTNCDH